MGPAWASPTLASCPHNFHVINHPQTTTEKTGKSFIMPRWNTQRRLRDFLICLVSLTMPWWNTWCRLQDFLICWCYRPCHSKLHSVDYRTHVSTHVRRDHTMIDWKWTEKKDYKGGKLYRLRTHYETANWDTNNYTWHSFISQLKVLFTVQRNTVSVIWFNCRTSGSPHDAVSICLV